MERWRPLAEDYDPVKCGSIDGTDTEVHDRAVNRAACARYKPNKGVKGNPCKTLFVGGLSHETTESTLHQLFSTFGTLENTSLVRDVVSGFSKGYAFIEFKSRNSAKDAYSEAHKLIIDGKCILVDYELERTMKGWKPRRLGGGFGGRKESGQLRFGCRDRPFKRPIILKAQDSLHRRENYNKARHEERSRHDHHTSFHKGRKYHDRHR